MAARTKNPDWEWLSLLDIDGPFLSRPALKSFYSAGLPKPDSSVDDVNATFAEEFVRWSTEWSAAPDRYNAARDRWVEVVLRKLLDWSDDLELSPLGLQAASPNGAVTVSPWAALRRADSAPAALVTVVDRTNDLRTIGTDGWAANAIDRMAVLLRKSDTTIGIVTDGRWWALVSAANDVTTASGVWDALLWREERPSRDAFLALAGFASLAGGQPEKRLPLLFAESVASAEQITEALGDQVRRAVELVLQSMSDTHLRALAKGDLSPLPENGQKVYEGAVTTLMRVVFLLFAEERGLLPEHDLYRSAYAIAGIREGLQREATATSAEALDHSWEAWHRLLAASNAVYGGASFEDMRMPAYGGSLFDPDRFPWLQSTDAQGRLQVRLTDRTMLAVLRAVQTIEDGAMQLSFRDLDVEQIGYVYEGLLSYSAAFVADVTVGLNGKSGYEPEISLNALEVIAESTDDPADFANRLTTHLKKTQEKSVPPTAKQVAKALSTNGFEATSDAQARLRHVLIGDDELAVRLQPFHGLIRDDLRGFPYVVPANGLVMTESSERANTGTHYTPRSLAEEVVLHALEPLVYRPGPLDTADSEKWELKSSAEILALKVADIAAGSGAFLVAAARYLAARLVEARIQEGLDLSCESETQRWALREVVARCLYGADINGMAVEMCKLSLWLISMDQGRPFSFVDDRVFVGNSLLGLTTAAQLEAQHLYPEQRRGKRQLLSIDVEGDLERAAQLRRELTSGQVDDADRMRSTRAKRALLLQSNRITAKLRDVADGVVSTGLMEGGKSGPKTEARYDELADALLNAYPGENTDGDRHRLDERLGAGLTLTVPGRQERWMPLNWIVEAPDVMLDDGGFDAIIGNPPFLGGSKISGAMGPNIRSLLPELLADGQSGNADLAAYFFLRAMQLVAPEGTLGLIATNTIAQGGTREVGLDRMLHRGLVIVRAIKSRPWPAKSANLEFAAVWATKRSVPPTVPRICDGVAAGRISSLLEPAGRVDGPPIRLRENRGIAFEGYKPYGMGFIVDLDTARDWIIEDRRNAAVLFPYLNGEDINTRSDSSGSRWLVDFADMPQDIARTYDAPFRHVERLVRPERALNNRKAYRDYWWQLAEKRPGLRAAKASSAEVVVLAKVSRTMMPIRTQANVAFSEQVHVFVGVDNAQLAVLSSSPHQLWAIKHGTTMRTDPRYLISDAFETFPRPRSTSLLEALGEELERKRREIMLRRRLGLTSLYNLANSPSVEEDVDVEVIRSIHMRIDEAVIEAYGWDSIALNHGFHTFRQIERWTVGPGARDDILDRLLEENHRRADAEIKSPKVKRSSGFTASERPEGALI